MVLSRAIYFRRYSSKDLVLSIRNHFAYVCACTSSLLAYISARTRLRKKGKEDPQKQTVGVFSKRASAKAFAGYWLLSEKRPCHYGRSGKFLSINHLIKISISGTNVNKIRTIISTFKVDITIVLLGFFDFSPVGT